MRIHAFPLGTQSFSLCIYCKPSVRISLDLIVVRPGNRNGLIKSRKLMKKNLTCKQVHEKKVLFKRKLAILRAIFRKRMKRYCRVFWVLQWYRNDGRRFVANCDVELVKTKVEIDCNLTLVRAQHWKKMGKNNSYRRWHTRMTLGQHGRRRTM